MGFHCTIITKASKIRNWVERVASQSSEYEKDKRGQKYKLVRRFDLWIELDFDSNNNLVNFYQFKALSDDSEKSVEESCY